MRQITQKNVLTACNHHINLKTGTAPLSAYNEKKTSSPEEGICFVDFGVMNDCMSSKTGDCSAIAIHFINQFLCLRNIFFRHQDFRRAVTVARFEEILDAVLTQQALHLCLLRSITGVIELNHV